MTPKRSSIVRLLERRNNSLTNVPINENINNQTVNPRHSSVVRQNSDENSKEGSE